MASYARYLRDTRETPAPVARDGRVFAKSDVKPLGVDGVFQSLTGFELRLFRSRNLDAFAGAWVAASGRSAVCNGEGAEADEANFVTGLQRACDGINNAINSFGGVSFRQVGNASNCGNKIILVQGKIP